MAATQPAINPIVQLRRHSRHPSFSSTNPNSQIVQSDSDDTNPIFYANLLCPSTQTLSIYRFPWTIPAAGNRHHQSTRNALIYDLSLNLTIENTNKRLDVQYYTIEAGAFYEDMQFANIVLDPFYQPVGNVSSVQPVFRGQNTVALGDQEVYGYFKDKNSGIYEIDVKLYLRMRFKFFWFIQSPKFKPTVYCDLKIPFNVDGKSSGAFQHTECG